MPRTSKSKADDSATELPKASVQSTQEEAGAGHNDYPRLAEILRFLSDNSRSRHYDCIQLDGTFESSHNYEHLCQDYSRGEEAEPIHDRERLTAVRSLSL